MRRRSVSSPSTETLIALENKWVNALQNADTATLNSILADSYVDTDDQGVHPCLPTSRLEKRY